jgi:hypothetical protein
MYIYIKNKAVTAVTVVTPRIGEPVAHATACSVSFSLRIVNMLKDVLHRLEVGLLDIHASTSPAPNGNSRESRRKALPGRKGIDL